MMDESMLTLDGAFRSACLDWLRGDDDLMLLVNGIYESAPVQASAPYIVIQTGLCSDWGTKDRAGCDLRLGIDIVDRGESPERTAVIAQALQQRMRAMDHRPRYGVYEIAGLYFLRSRLQKQAGGDWLLMSDVQIKLLDAV